MANEKTDIVSDTQHSVVVNITIYFFIYFNFLTVTERFDFSFLANSAIHEFVLISGVIGLLKCAVSTIHDKCEVKKSTRLKNEIVIGLVGIALCGIVPRILVFFMESESTYVEQREGFVLITVTDQHLTYMLRSNVASVQLYFLFVMECDYLLKFDGNRGPAYVMLKIIHSILLIITIIIGWVYGDDITTITIIVNQILFSMLFIPSTMDLYGVLSGDRKLRENVDGESDLRNECKICLLEFNETQTIPRILVQCGHTICEMCVGKLLRQNNGQRVICPYCQKPTVVDGPATLLPKNFALLDFIEGKKN